MKVGIDIQSTMGKKTGIGYYTSRLIDNFETEDNIKFSYYSDSNKPDFNSLERIYWENFSLKSKIAKDPIDILHVPGFAGPFKKGKYKKVTTVHDLIGVIFPQNLGFVSKFYWQKWLPACIRSSDAVISVSEHTKKDIIKFLNIPESRIHVILSAVEKRFMPVRAIEEMERVKEKYDLPDNFILNVGSIEPRKNICGLIEAFASYIQEKNKDLNLVIAGKKTWGYKKAYETVSRKKVSHKVFFTDYVEDEDLPILYNLAKFFIFPSFYEGFGLPVLESMACGTPVISSNTSSLPEVTADAALLVDPHRGGDIKEAIEEMDSSSSLRDEYSHKGLIQAKKFSWEKTSNDTLQVYRKILEP